MPGAFDRARDIVSLFLGWSARFRTNSWRTSPRRPVRGHGKRSRHFLRGETVQARFTVGDSAFFHGIQHYYAAHRHGNASTPDLEREFERTAGRPLGWFFDQWMRRPGFAELETTWRWNGGAKQLGLTVKQGRASRPIGCRSRST